MRRRNAAARCKMRRRGCSSTYRSGPQVARGHLPHTLLSTPPTFASTNHVSLGHEFAKNSAQSGSSKNNTFLVQIMGDSRMYELQVWLDLGAEVTRVFCSLPLSTSWLHLPLSCCIHRQAALQNPVCISHCGKSQLRC